MLKFKKFDVDDVITDMFGNVSEGNVIFVTEDKLVRLGYLYREYLHNGCTKYYFRSNGVDYRADECVYCEVTVEEN